MTAAVSACKQSKSTTALLQEVLSKLEEIESASYLKRVEVWEHSDTVPLFVEYQFTREIFNPGDTTIGSCVLSFDTLVPFRLRSAYDGKVRATVNDASKSVVIDNFTARPLPFRPVSPPFFNYAKSIIQYIITTNDSITVESAELEKDFHIKLTINEGTQVEFFGKPHYMPDNPYIYGETTSLYELWIDKAGKLPHKVRREMFHNISVESCSDAQFNKLSADDFNIYDYFPGDYEIRPYSVSARAAKPALTDKQAPDWILTDRNEQSVSLSELRGKVILLQFTGIGCGPCQASIPMLKEVEERFKKEEFELVAIETWRQKPSSLKSYSDRYDFNYRIVAGTDKVVEDYQTGGAVPVFFILDKEHVIRKVINGYSEQTSRREIVNAIVELL